MCHIHRSESTSIFGTNNVICREIWLHLWFLPYQFSIFDDVGSWQPCYWASDYLPSQKIYSPHTNGVDFFQALRTTTLCRYLHELDKWWIQNNLRQLHESVRKELLNKSYCIHKHSLLLNNDIVLSGSSPVQFSLAVSIFPSAWLPILRLQSIVFKK